MALNPYRKMSFSTQATGDSKEVTLPVTNEMPKANYMYVSPNFS